MYRLGILRHAAAAQGSVSGGDFERPLTAEGRAAAAALGDRLREKRFVPQVVLCSPARRTRETLAGLKLETASVDFAEEIYNASPGDLFKQIKNLEDSVLSALIVGHNPGIHSLARFLAGEGDDRLQMRLLSYAPGTFTWLESSEPWVRWIPGQAQLLDVMTEGG